MFPALNMELEIVRTVLQNDCNDVYVCTDLKKNTGVFYTMISIKDTRYRKIMAQKLNSDGMFFSNHDFVGSFIYESCLNLVFRYYHENLLSLLGGVYLVEYKDCKNAALALITACAECAASPDIGMLLLDERNINITKEGEVQFNYFLDYSKFTADIEERVYLRRLAEVVFGILELNYKARYDRPENYPGDLRLFYLKMTTTGFPSFGHMISMIRGMADKPKEMRGILWWVQSHFQRGRSFLFRNSTNTFLSILLMVTLIYAANQIYSRWKIQKAYESNVSYYGIEYIGTVYLGDEE